MVDTTPMSGAQPEAEGVPASAPGVGEERRAGLTPVSLLLTVGLAYFLYKVQVVVVLLIVGILLATGISRPVALLHRRGLPRGAAILVMYLAILLIMAGVIYLLVPPVIAEGTRFARDAPGLIETWRIQLESSDSAVVRTTSVRAFAAIDDALQSGNIPVPTDLALGIVSGIGSGLVALFTIFLIAFYWLTERATIRRAVTLLFRLEQRTRVQHLWDEVEAKLGDWLRGQLLLMVVIGTAATVAYGLMGLSFWLLLGVIAGLTEAIPNVGPILGAVPAVLVALTQDWKLAVAVVIFVTVLQLTENAILVPRIMKGAVGLSPLTVILAILAGSEFRGVAGALLAVPIAGALSVVLGDLLREKRTLEVLAGRRQGVLRRFLQARRRAAPPVADDAER